MLVQDRAPIKSHGGRAFSKLPSSLSSTNSSFRNRKFGSSTYSKFSTKHQPHFPKKHNSLNLPLHTRSFKMSSPKRSHPGDGADDRPVKIQKVENLITGLEGSKFDITGLMDKFDDPTEATSSLLREYLLRRKPLRSNTQQLHKKRRISNKVNADRKIMQTPSQKGMRNFKGFLCYRSSLLQALLHSPKIANWFLEHHQPHSCVADSQDDCVSCSLRKVVLAYWTGQPSDLHQVLLKLYDLFKNAGWPSGQQDPEEQLTWIMKQMRAEVPSRTFAALEATNSLITNACVKCDNCGHLSKTSGHATSHLSIPLRPRLPGDLSAYVHGYLTETVEGYKCDECKDTKDKTRYQEIAHSPDVLMLQFKRYDFGDKDNYYVRMKTTLNLNQYRAEFNQDDSQYELFASVLHAGDRDFGHYKCLAKNGEDGWFEFDDAQVRKRPAAAVVTKEREFTPYLLFYSRITKKDSKE